MLLALALSPGFARAAAVSADASTTTTTQLGPADVFDIDTGTTASVAARVPAAAAAAPPTSTSASASAGSPAPAATPAPSADESRKSELDPDSLLPGSIPRLDDLGFGKQGGELSVYSPGGIVWLGTEGFARDKVEIRYKDMTIRADRAVFSQETSEVQAEGNITVEGRDVRLIASAVRYNFKAREGVAYGVDGRHKEFFFRVEGDETTQGPAFRRVSEEQALFRGSTFTGCDFPVPHYYIRGSEVILMLNDRVFIRDAVLYVREVPVLYFPAYTRSLNESSPWNFRFGYRRRSGVYGRVTYTYKHSLDEPRYDNPGKYRSRSRGQAEVSVDEFVKRGPGIGLRYRYSFNYDQHRGNMMVYGIRDHLWDEDEVIDPDTPPNRWALNWKHRSVLAEHWLAQMNIDEVSDPDLYRDVLDAVEDTELRRRPERRARWAVTYARELWAARLTVDLRDRVGIDAFQNPSDPYSDNLNYDPNPLSDPDFKGDSISGRRYAQVTRRAPQFDLASSYIKIWGTPFYFRSEAHAIHAKDAGFNHLDDIDDADVDGANADLGIMNGIPLGERYTWTNEIRGGAGYFERSRTDLGLDESVAGLTPPGYPNTVGNIYAVDRDTFLTGRRERSFRDVDSAFPYGEYSSRLNARFTDTLEGYVKYTYSATDSDSLGEFYRRIGDRYARNDIYAFPVRRNMAEAFLNYFLLYPNINLFTRGGTSLSPDRDRAPFDLLRYAGAGGGWTNNSKELRVSASADYQERQIRDLTDPNEYQQKSVVYSAQIQYVPRHERWWARLQLFAIDTLTHDPLAVPADQKDKFNENDTEVTISPLVGRRVGPKYSVEVAGGYNTKIKDWKDGKVILKRDLHDAEVAVEGGFRAVDNNDGDETRIRREGEVRFGFRLKTPGTSSGLAGGGVSTLLDRERQAEVAY